MSVMVEMPGIQPVYPEGPTAATLPISEHDNDSLILRLHMTLNHLSRWISPVTNQEPLERSAQRGFPSVMELLQQMRDAELIGYARLHAIANYVNPDLDQIPDPRLAPERQIEGFDRSPLTVMAEFRRLRQSTCGLLRGLPDSAWSRVGTSRLEHDWQIRTLAEYLVNHDVELLGEIDLALDRSGVREDINAVSRVPLEELLRLVPVRPKSK